MTFSVPLPRGTTHDPSNWSLGTASGPQALQTAVLDRWADGSARWVLVDARIDLVSGHEPLEIETAGQAVPHAIPLSVSIDADATVVRTGAATFTFRPGNGFPFATVVREAGEQIAPGGARLVVTDAAGAAHDAVVRNIRATTKGPLRAEIALAGDVEAGDGRRLALTASVTLFAGLSTARVRVTLSNPDAARHAGGFWDLGDPGSILIKDASIRIELAGTPGPIDVACSPELTMAMAPQATPFELYQDSSGGERWQSSNHINRERRIPVSFRGYRLRAGGKESIGLRATPILTVRRGEVACSIAVPHFWQDFPKALEAGESGTTVRLFPGQFSDLHEVQGGEQKTHECWVSFGGDSVSPVPLDWCRSPTLACVDPAWTMASGAVPFLAPLESAHAALVNVAIEGADRFELKREVIDEYGWRHFGEIYGDHESVRQKEPPVVSHYNNQYDPVSGFILQYLRTADARWWTMAQELAWHVRDVDIYHTTRDKSAYNGGVFWHTYHYGDADTATHRTYPSSGKGHTHGGGPSADHNYTSGLMLHYFLTGDTASRDAVIGLGQFVINIDDGNLTVFRWLDRSATGGATWSAADYVGPGRGPANSLNALIDAWRLSGDRRFATKAEEVIRRVVHPAEDVARHKLDDPEVRWFYTMFLQALGKYLHLKTERDELDAAYTYGRETLLHYARWMAVHEYPWLEKPEKLEFPTETWAAQDIRKSDIFHMAALHAAGAERALFQERGRFFHRNSAETLSQMGTRTLARPIVVLLTSGFADPWMQRMPSTTLPSGPPLGEAGGPQPFVPQRVRAMKRAKRLMMGAAAVSLTLVLWWVASWIL